MKVAWAAIVAFLLLLTSGISHAKGRPACTEVRREFASKKVGPLKLVPYRAIQTNKLQICSNAMPTCCNRKMEKKYQVAAYNTLEVSLRKKIAYLKSHFKRFLTDFKDDYNNLLQASRGDVFLALNSTSLDMNDGSSLRIDLETFYSELEFEKEHNRNDVIPNLKPALGRLFSFLFVEAFKQQSENELDSANEECVKQEVKKIPYYSTIVDLVLRQISNSVNLTSAFVHGAETGLEILKFSPEHMISKECEESLVKMQYCSHCYGMTLIKPCSHYCRNVMSGCLVGYSEIDRFWSHYVSAIYDVTELIFSNDADPQIALNGFVNQVKLMLNFKLEKESVSEITEKCSLPSNRPKRSSDPTLPADDVRLKLSHQRRRQRRRHRTTNFELSVEPDLEGEQFTPRRIIPPPHKMLQWGPSRGGHAQKNKRKDKETIQQLKSEESIIEQELVEMTMKVKVKRFIGHLNISSDFFLTLSDEMCDRHSKSDFAVSTFRSCWNGIAITDNYTLPLVSRHLESQFTNPEVDVKGVEDGVIAVVKKLQTISKFLMVQAGKKNIPDVLLTTPPYVSVTDQSEPPCDDDEDLCAEGSGSKMLILNPPTRKDLKETKKTDRKKKTRGKNGKTKRPKHKNLSENVQIDLDEVIRDLLPAEDDSSTNPPLAEATKPKLNSQKGRNPENSALNLFDFFIVSRTITLLFLFCIALSFNS